MNSAAPAPGSPASLREMNRGRILDAVREHGVLTQVEIAAVTRLSPATVSNLVKELDSAGIVELAPSIRNGRRAVQVALAAARGLLGAVVFGDREVQVAVGRDEGDILARQRSPLAAGYAADEQLERAVRLLGELVEASGHSMPELRALTVGLPAPIDTVSGQVGADGILPGWRGIPIASELTATLGVPVSVNNTANLATLAEARGGTLRGVGTGVYVHAAHTVGAGLILAGELFRGSAGTAGEIGHVTVDEDGPLCRCGNRGCLDTYVGADALARTLQPTHGHLSLGGVIRRCLEGDAGCARVLGDAGRHLGVALANVVNLFNPEVIAVGGELARAGEVLLRPLRETVERRAIPSAVHSVAIVRADTASADGPVLGALSDAAGLRHDAGRSVPTGTGPR